MAGDYNDSEMAQNQPVYTSGLAIASLILGIVGVVCLGPFGGIPAVICGHIALSNIRKSDGTEGGRGMAIAGLVTGYIGIAYIVISIAIMASSVLPALSQAREKARRIACAGNLKQIGVAMRMYEGEKEKRFPDDLATLWKNDYLTTGIVYICPSTTDTPATSADQLSSDHHCSYLYFGKGLTEVCRGHAAGQTILAADKPGNHTRFVNILFADGHVAGYVLSSGMDLKGLAQEKHFYLPAPAP